MEKNLFMSLGARGRSEVLRRHEKNNNESTSSRLGSHAMLVSFFEWNSLNKSRFLVPTFTLTHLLSCEQSSGQTSVTDKISEWKAGQAWQHRRSYSRRGGGARKRKQRSLLGPAGTFSKFPRRVRLWVHSDTEAVLAYPSPLLVSIKCDCTDLLPN